MRRLTDDLDAARADVQQLQPQADAAAAAQRDARLLEEEVARLKDALTRATEDAETMQALKESMAAASAALAALESVEAQREREEEVEMGQERVYRRQDALVAGDGDGNGDGDDGNDDGAGAGAGSGAGAATTSITSTTTTHTMTTTNTFEYDVAFRFEAGGPASQASVSAVEAAARVTQQRAERSVEWAAGPALAGLPEVSRAVRRLCAWLRTSGVALAESSRLLGAAARDSRTQARLLHDEIHSLRSELDAARDSVRVTESRLTTAEATANRLARDRDSDVAHLNALVDQLKEREQAARQEALDRQTELRTAQDTLRTVEQELHTARTDLGAATTRAQRSDTDVSTLRADLTAAQSTADATRAELDGVRQALDVAHDSMKNLELEKRLALEKVSVLEGRESAGASRVGELVTQVATLENELAAVRSEKTTVVAELEALLQRAEFLTADRQALEQRSESTEQTLREELVAARSEASRAQSAAVSQAQQLQDSERQLSALQSSVLGLTVDVETSRRSLASALDDARRRLAEVAPTAGVAGVDDFSRASMWPRHSFADLDGRSSRGRPESPATASSRRSGSPLSRSGPRDDAAAAAAADANSHGLQHSVSLAVGMLRRLADTHADTVTRLAAASTESERLRAAMESAKPHIKALEDASSSAQQRAASLVAAEARVTELKAALASEQSQHVVLSSEVRQLRQKVLDLQTELERTSSRMGQFAGECDVAREAEHRASGTVARLQTRIVELEAEVARASGSVSVEASERSRLEHEHDRDHVRLTQARAQVSELKAANTELQVEHAAVRSSLGACRRHDAHFRTEGAPGGGGGRHRIQGRPDCRLGGAPGRSRAVETRT